MIGTPPRRGWRERIETGLWRNHRVACKASAAHRVGRRCDCPYEFKAPHEVPGRTRTVSFVGTITEARRERARLRGAGRPTVPTPTAASEMTLTEFARVYMHSKRPYLQPLTLETTSRDYRRWVYPAFGHRALAEITRPGVRDWLREMIDEGASRRAYTGALAALRVILSHAVDEDLLPSNPAMGLKLPPRSADEPTGVKRVLTKKQLRLLCNKKKVGLAHASMFAVAGLAGLRRGEVIALRWRDVRLQEGRLWVRRSAEQIRGVKRIKTTKSGRDRRVAIHEDLVQLLAAWYRLSVDGQGGDADEFVWPGLGGGPMSEGTPSQALRRAQVSLGLVDAGGKPLVSFHGLRHTAASHMLQRGVPIVTVAAQLGHRNSSVTAQIYEHLVDDSQLDAAASSARGRR